MGPKVLPANLQNDRFYGEYVKSFKYGTSQSGNTSNLLGNSVQSAIRAANQALYALEHSPDSYQGRTAEQIENRMKEKMFYQEFIKRLQAI